jgi:hypothetical protein
VGNHFLPPKLRSRHLETFFPKEISRLSIMNTAYNREKRDKKNPPPTSLF